MPMMIGYSKRANCTNAFALLVEGWNELVQEGWTPDGVAGLSGAGFGRGHLRREQGG